MHHADETIQGVQLNAYCFADTESGEIGGQDKLVGRQYKIYDIHIHMFSITEALINVRM